QAGVDVVTLAPEATYTAKNINDIGTWLPLQVSTSLAFAESKKKSERLLDAHARKRKALSDGVKYSKAGPFWLRLSADRKTCIFNGILYDTADGQRMVLNTSNRTRVLVSGGAIRNKPGSVFRSIPYDVVESAILSQLYELKTADVVGKKAQTNDIDTWSAKLTA